MFVVVVFVVVCVVCFVLCVFVAFVFFLTFQLFFFLLPAVLSASRYRHPLGGNPGGSGTWNMLRIVPT